MQGVNPLCSREKRSEGCKWDSFYTLHINVNFWDIIESIISLIIGLPF
jgi:hypothetical protein